MRYRDLYSMIACAIGLSCVASAAPAGSSGADLTLGLAAPGASLTALAGEPLLIEYRLTNVSSDPIIVPVGSATRRLASAQLFSLGVAVAGSSRVAPFGPGIRLGFETVHTLKPGDSLDGVFVATSLVSLSVPGEYTLRITTHIPYRSVLGGSAGAACVSSEASLRTTLDLPLRVDPADATRLRSEALALAGTAVGRGSSDAKFGAIEQLFSMPAEAANTAWRSMFADPALTDPFLLRAMRELWYVDPASGSDLLCAIAQDSSRSSEVRESARGMLRSMYLCASGDLKRQLGEKLAAIDGKLPKG